MEQTITPVCPLCKGALRLGDQAYSCDPCGRSYPVICGIPDFRIVPDRYISMEDDRAKGKRLFEASAGRSFKEMIDLYWSITPEVPPKLARRFTAHMLANPDIREIPLTEPFLDVGCQTGGLLAAAGGGGGVDVAFRWLVVARVRLHEAGVDAPVYCANAEHLPFPSDAFRTVVAIDLIEHVADPRPVLAECHRVGEVCYIETNNRCSALPEPHSGVWGVGWMPRALQRGYVRLMTGRDYRNICLRSPGEVERWAREAGFRERRLSPAPAIRPAVYNQMRRSSIFSWVLRRIGPRFQLVCRK